VTSHTTSPLGSERSSYATALFTPFRDAWLAARARVALFAAAGSQVGEVAVEAVRGNVVLTGDVATAAIRAEAERIVRALDVGVSNQIRVRGAHALRTGNADAEIRVAVMRRLRQSVALRASTVHVASIYDGVVTLAGTAPSAFAADAAFELTVHVPGVRRVISDVAITSHADVGEDADAA
jgi:osmotically-inducible protein OsmY